MSNVVFDQKAPVSVSQPGEWEDLLLEWSGAPHDLDLSSPDLLHEIFERQADRHPDSIALLCERNELTYKRLDERANQLARFLRSKGVRRGDRVGLYLPRGLDVYIGLLAILKAGAAYVPLDPECPADRADFIMADSNSKALLTTGALAASLASYQGIILRLDQEKDSIKAQAPDRLSRAEAAAGFEDPCYIIYTSGSTGRPKGVLVTHRNVCNLVKASQRIYEMSSADRVFQGFSLSFDASVEEVWAAFGAGATLVAGTRDMMQAGPNLAFLLAQARITVLSCVPTLLSLFDADIPSLRLLIVGGETCPQYLVDRWAKSGRKMMNTYGPTEATVIATHAECQPRQPVTIGKAVPNYRVYVLDAELRLVPPGVEGELHIAGPGVSPGYINQPKLTAEKFIENPYRNRLDPSYARFYSRLYRTGDRARFKANGALEFLGRMDQQVKLRGFRIELDEIESVLNEAPGVRGGVAAIYAGGHGLERLAAYVIANPGCQVSAAGIRNFLRQRLPPFMVPSTVDLLPEFPRLPSGKIDRKRLPSPTGLNGDSESGVLDSTTPLEKKLAGLCLELFRVPKLSIHDNLFTDLGGDSLLVATLISAMRSDPELHNANFSDVYAHPTIAGLCQFLEKNTHKPDEASEKEFRVASRWSFGIAGLAQLLAIYVWHGFSWLLFLLPFVAAFKGAIFTAADLNQLVKSPFSLTAFFSLSLLGYPLLLALSIVLKWVVLGRIKPGKFPLWGLYYLRWWLVARIQGLCHLEYLTGSPLMNLYARLMGMRLGKNVHLGACHIHAFDLVEVGDDSSIGLDAQLPGYVVEDGWLKIGSIQIGKRCFVGARSFVGENTIMEDGAMLDDLSALPAGQTIRQNQRHAGSPACLTPAAHSPAPQAAKQAIGSPGCRGWYFFLHTLGLGCLLCVPSLAILPGAVLIYYALLQPSWGWLAASMPMAAVSFVVSLCLVIAAAKWMLVGKMGAGCHPIRSWFYVRKWTLDNFLQLSLNLVNSIYATLYLLPWFRLLGAKLGRRAEISTVAHVSPDLLAIGNQSFLADSACIGALRVQDGVAFFAPTRLGDRSFIGNSAFIPAGATIGDGSLIGCLSTPPTGDVPMSHQSWLGSPAIHLPRRDVNKDFPESVTFNPSVKLICQRLAVEFFRVTIPSLFAIASSVVTLALVIFLMHRVPLWQLVPLLAVISLASSLLACAFVIITKWLVVGRYQPGIHPLWSHFVWRSELITALHENIAVPALLNWLKGTPFATFYFRLMGSKVGSRVYFDTTQITEMDLISIGDDAALNGDCTLQTHLFEDRVMKMSHLHIGKKCSVGAMAVVLYDSRMEEGSRIAGLTLLMKGETLPAWSCWEGSPAQRIRAAMAIPR